MNDIIAKHLGSSHEQWYFNKRKLNLTDKQITFIENNRTRLLENATKEEITVAQYLDNEGIFFFPQLPIFIEQIHTTFWVDFFIPKGKIVLEIDGPSHNRLRTKEKDAYRDAFMRDRQYTIIRITNKDVNNGSYKETLSNILSTCKSKTNRRNKKQSICRAYEKILGKVLQEVEAAIIAYPAQPICFSTANRYVINFMTKGHIRHVLYEKASSIKSMAEEKGVIMYWKYTGKKAKEWMAKRIHNNVTQQYILAFRHEAREITLNAQ